MNCPLAKDETRSLLLDYSAGRLAPADAAAMERHVEDCVACSAFRLEQMAVWDALDMWEPAPVSTDFNRRLWQRIDAVSNAPWYRRLGEWAVFPAWRPAFPLLLALLLIVGGFLLDHRAGVPAQPHPAASGVTMTEVDQLEQTLDDIQLLRQSDPAPVPGGSSRQM